MTSPVPRNRWNNQSGAFDLPSILVGVVVVGILTAGVLAAIFGVIPWSQNRAAKQDLTAVNTAQGVALAKDGGFQAKTGLVDAGLLGSGLPEDLDIRADTAGECYVAVNTAGSGERFVISNEETSPRELTSRDKWCDGQTIAPDPNEPVMVSTWDTSLAASCKEITLPIDNFKGTVTWGDGTVDSKTSHAFATTGPVTIRIDGTFSKWGSSSYFSGWDDIGCLVSVDRWGATGTTDLSYAFAWAPSLKHVESIPPSTSNMSNAFHRVASDFTIGTFDTSNVTNMAYMFYGAPAFNQPVKFDSSRVTNMGFMFGDAKAFNQPVKLDTSSVTNMGYMFSGASAFNQPLEFNTSSVTSMASMFSSASAFNQPVKFTNTASVTSMGSMFSSAVAFNQPLNFDTSNVTDMSYMFFYASEFTHPLNFDTSNVTSMGHMFNQAAEFNQPLNFDTSNVQNMFKMFGGAKAYNQDLSAWDVSKVTDHTSFGTGSAWKLPQPNWVS